MKATRPRAAITSVTVMAMVWGLSLAPVAAQDTLAAPAILPSLAQWSSEPGAFEFGTDPRIVVGSEADEVQRDASTFAAELSTRLGRPAQVAGPTTTPAAGDVLLDLDPSRVDLGDEGYELVVGSSVRVTGAASAGVFYGTRTILQMLATTQVLPRGRAIDRPAYPERGVGVCACYVHISMAWFERLMHDMAYLKLNQLWIETKVKSGTFPKTAFWGYYTKDEVRQLSQMAKRHHITLVPGINSPGQLDPYLENHPEYQLANAAGQRQPSLLDITSAGARKFYRDLVDEALQVWDTPFWHLGANEYLLASAYAQYPQIQLHAWQEYGATATPHDVFVDFVNEVNAHVKAQGKTLRMWNDGLTGQNTIPLDSDITVEHGLDVSQQRPSQLLAAGHQVMNAASALHLVRGGFTMDTQALYDSDWTPLRFEGETLTAPQPGVSGAKITLWPDTASAETENEVEAKAFMPLRFVAQVTWGGRRPTATYAQFQSLASATGHDPGWNNVDRRPLPDAEYPLVAPDLTVLRPTQTQAGATVGFADGVDAPWTLTATADGYYVVRSVATGLCLDVALGRRYLGAPLEAGVAITQQSCNPETRTQRWQVEHDNREVTLVNAITQMALARRRADGVAVQMPPDLQEPTPLRIDAPSDEQRCPSAVQPAPSIRVRTCDDLDRIIHKASQVVPRPSQVMWQQHEVTAFTHFGMNTFTNREWGSGMEQEARFDPTAIDVQQWMQAHQAMGAGLTMLTAKHHDGFVLYPTRYSPHSIIASPWWVTPENCPEAEAVAAARAQAEATRNLGHGDAFWQVRDAGCTNPEGDLLGTYIDAARAAGMRVGVYMSPSDGAELPHQWHQQQYIPALLRKPATQWSNAERATIEDAPRPPGGLGRFGNGSQRFPRTIPTLVANDDRAAAVAAGELPTFDVWVNDYDAYYLNQLYELFTQYGPIDELWLDGANPWGGAGITQQYDFTTWFDLVKKLSPDTVIFAGPQGTRWVGNESGTARTTEWSVVPATADPDTAHNEGLIPGGAQIPDVGSRALLADPRVRYVQWYPAEADVSIRPGWFHHPNQVPKTPAQLTTIYRNSVGRNAVLLLNVPPALDGRVAQADFDNLTAFGNAVRSTYGTNKLAPVGHAGDPVLSALTDDILATAWEPPDGDSANLMLDLPSGSVTFDQVRLGEDITRGQRVEQFAVDRWDGTQWIEAATGTTIGYSRILVLPQPIQTNRVRIRVLQARGTPHLSFLGLYTTVSP